MEPVWEKNRNRHRLNDEEKELCEEALEGCPVEAIGNDGEDQ